jgi:hypothetical protein
VIDEHSRVEAVELPASQQPDELVRLDSPIGGLRPGDHTSLIDEKRDEQGVHPDKVHPPPWVSRRPHVHLWTNPQCPRGVGRI